MARLFLTVLLFVTFLTACGEVGSVLDPAASNLTDVQRQEIEAWERQAREDLKDTRSFEPTDEWQEVAPNVWRIQTFDDRGELISESYHMEGLDAMGWVVENVWRPKAEQLRQQLAEHGLDEPVRAQLEHQLEMFERRIDDYERIRDSIGTLKIETLSCTPYAAATAGPTTASPGAKAYANARSCVQGSYASASATADGATNADSDSTPIGGYASASAVKYGTSACSAHGYANGYPAVSSREYYRCY